MSEDEDYHARKRVCDLGYLRHLFKREDGSVGYRCPAEPVDIYEKKGGDIADTVGRKCLCNGLMATIGLGQRRRSGNEKPIITVGDTVKSTVLALAGDRPSYSAADVLRYMRSKICGEVYVPSKVEEPVSVEA